MTSNSPVILLTGRPGIGKTTAIKKIISLLGRERCGGFCTREIRQAGQRSGFEIVTLAGQSDLLATKLPDIPFAGAALFGKYRVNLAAIDRLAVPAMLEAVQQNHIVFIDEIGPMEILSEVFCRAVLEILDSPNPVVGTIVQRPNPFADQVKGHRRVTVRQVTPGNRSRLPEWVYDELIKPRPSR
jgi:nucleoside-triphosphatase